MGLYHIEQRSVYLDSPIISWVWSLFLNPVMMSKSSLIMEERCSIAFRVDISSYVYFVESLSNTWCSAKEKIMGSALHINTRHHACTLRVMVMAHYLVVYLKCQCVQTFNSGCTGTCTCVICMLTYKPCEYTWFVCFVDCMWENPPYWSIHES